MLSDELRIPVMEMRIEKQGERRAEGKREIGAIGAEARSHRLWQ